MRWIILGLAALSLAACQKTSSERVAVKSAGGATAQRKAGLWEQTVTTDGRSQTTRLCLDAHAGTAFSLTTLDKAKACDPPRLSGAAHGFAFDQACNLGEGARETAHGTVSGDLGSAYRMTITTTVSGAKGPLINATRTSVVTAAWKGPCPAGMKPGEIDLPGGERLGG
jgi:hypothetical protein